MRQFEIMACASRSLTHSVTQSACQSRRSDCKPEKYATGLSSQSADRSPVAAARMGSSAGRGTKGSLGDRKSRESSRKRTRGVVTCTRKRPTRGFKAREGAERSAPKTSNRAATKKKETEGETEMQRRRSSSSSSRRSRSKTAKVWPVSF